MRQVAVWIATFGLVLAACTGGAQESLIDVERDFLDCIGEYTERWYAEPSNQYLLDEWRGMLCERQHVERDAVSALLLPILAHLSAEQVPQGRVQRYTDLVEPTLTVGATGLLLK